MPGDWAGPEGPDVADLSEIWDDEAGDVIRTSADAPDGAGGHAEAEPEPDVVVADPVNRGLLLKFLGSGAQLAPPPEVACRLAAGTPRTERPPLTMARAHAP